VEVDLPGVGMGDSPDLVSISPFAPGLIPSSELFSLFLADNFISSCASCHSVAQKTGSTRMVQPMPKLVNGKYIPVNDKKTMNW
jgi:hypothetical protein